MKKILTIIAIFLSLQAFGQQNRQFRKIDSTERVRVFNRNKKRSNEADLYKAAQMKSRQKSLQQLRFADSVIVRNRKKNHN